MSDDRVLHMFFHPRLSLILVKLEAGEIVYYKVNATEEQANNPKYVDYLREWVRENPHLPGVATFDPHVNESARECGYCGHIYHAVYPLGVMALECPLCGEMTRVDYD